MAPIAKDESKKTVLTRLSWYYMILISGIVVFTSAANQIDNSNEFKMAFVFGIITALLAFFAVLANYYEPSRQAMYEIKSFGQKIEGLLLIFFLIWNTVAVGYITHTGGVSNSSLNLYFGSWLMFIASVACFNDFLLQFDYSPTAVYQNNKTLRCWLCLWFSSLIVMGAGSDGYANVTSSSQMAYCVCLGIISLLFVTAAIMAHLGIVFDKVISPGGVSELSLAGLLVVWWTIGVIICTRSGQVASQSGNLYYSIWFSFFMAIWIVSCWKFVSGEDLPTFKGDTPAKEPVTHEIGEEEEEEKEKTEDV